MALEPAKLSDFRLGGALGTGTTAMVYGAVHLATGRPVAIKMMVGAGPNPERRERFAREALLLAAVQSRHVCKILGFGFEKGHPFLVLERLNGETLDDKLRRDGPIPPALAFRWVEQLIAGVRDCHAAKIIHRDIKPSNIFLHRDEQGETAKLIDFGVARLREIAGSTEGLTSASHLIGSMGYMAPEQFANAKTVGFPADLYAVGVVIFRTFTGRLPFVSRSLDAVIRMKTEQPVPLVSSMPGMGDRPLLDWFVQTAMVREPLARFQSAREMLEQWANVIADFQRGSSPKGGGRDLVAADVDRRANVRRTPVPPPSHVRYETIADQDGQETERCPFDDLAAPTVPSHDDGGRDLFDEAAQTAQPHEHDAFDVPTRPNANLKKLVERELELHRARLREGR